MEEYVTFDDVLIKPVYNDIDSRHDVNTGLTLGKFQLSIPVMAANMDRVCESRMAIALGRLGGLGVIHRFNKIEEQFEEAKKVKDAGQIVAIALGIRDLEERAKRLSEIADIFVIDIAHGHCKNVIEAIKYLKNNHSQFIIAGNVATGEGAYDLEKAGADCIKIGIGPGSVCQTRFVTGCGAPQLSAIQEVRKRVKGPIIADGGIRTSGDIVKALAAGANIVMIGALISGTDESPGPIHTRSDGTKYKYYRGMASREANGREDVTPEGISIEVPYKGSVEGIIQNIIMGLKSGMTYVGARNIEELQKNAVFIKITNSGLRESMDKSKKNYI